MFFERIIKFLSNKYWVSGQFILICVLFIVDFFGGRFVRSFAELFVILILFESLVVLHEVGFNRTVFTEKMFMVYALFFILLELCIYRSVRSYCLAIALIIIGFPHIMSIFGSEYNDWLYESHGMQIVDNNGRLHPLFKKVGYLLVTAGFVIIILTYYFVR